MKTRLAARPELFQMRQTHNSLPSVNATDCEFIISLLSFFTSLLLLSSCKNTAVNRKSAVFLYHFSVFMIYKQLFLNLFKIYSYFCHPFPQSIGYTNIRVKKDPSNTVLAPGQLPGRNAHDSKVARQTILSLRYDI